MVRRPRLGNMSLPRLTGWLKGSIYHVAISLELFPRSVLDLEGSTDSGYLPLASSNHTGDCSWVSDPCLESYGLANKRSLPGTPIWLAAVYGSSFGRVNKYWIPAMW